MRLRMLRETVSSSAMSSFISDSPSRGADCRLRRDPRQQGVPVHRGGFLRIRVHAGRL
jgi:hypothetical protein